MRKATRADLHVIVALMKENDAEEVPGRFLDTELLIVKVQHDDGEWERVPVAFTKEKGGSWWCFTDEASFGSQIYMAKKRELQERIDKSWDDYAKRRK